MDRRRAGGVRVVELPGEHGGVFDPLVSPHACYLALGADRRAREAAYRQLFDEALPASLVMEIREYLQQQKALGSDRFRAWVESRTGRFATARHPNVRHDARIVPDTISCLTTFLAVPGAVPENGPRHHR